MKQIIDKETGEIIEVETENEIAERKLLEVGAIDKNIYEMLEQYLYEKDRFETLKYKLKKAMEENNIKKWDNDYFTASLVSSGIASSVDVEKLKADGLYDKYEKLSIRNSYLNIRFKKDK